MSPGTGNRPTRRDPHRPGGSGRERRAAPHRGNAPDRPSASLRTAPPPGARTGRAPRGSRLWQPVRGRHRGVLVALLVPVTVGAAAWALLASSLLAVGEVRVSGTVALAAEEVRVAAAVRPGTPLLGLDTAAVERRVQDLRRVSGAEVSRSLTGTVEVRVTERVPVAVLPAPDGIHLVDATATDFATQPDPPPGLPALRVPGTAPGASTTEPTTEPTMGAAVEVLTGLPQPLRGQVRTVAASSPVDVTLLLADGREVRWGATDQGERKAAVLGALLTQPGEVYDVTTPDLPTIS